MVLAVQINKGVSEQAFRAAVVGMEIVGSMAIRCPILWNVCINVLAMKGGGANERDNFMER